MLSLFSRERIASWRRRCSLSRGCDGVSTRVEASLSPPRLICGSGVGIDGHSSLHLGVRLGSFVFCAKGKGDAESVAADQFLVWLGVEASGVGLEEILVSLGRFGLNRHGCGLGIDVVLDGDGKLGIQPSSRGDVLTPILGLSFFGAGNFDAGEKNRYAGGAWAAGLRQVVLGLVFLVEAVRQWIGLACGSVCRMGVVVLVAGAGGDSHLRLQVVLILILVQGPSGVVAIFGVWIWHVVTPSAAVTGDVGLVVVFTTMFGMAGGGLRTVNPKAEMLWMEDVRSWSATAICRRPARVEYGGVGLIVWARLYWLGPGVALAVGDELLWWAWSDWVFLTRFCF